MSSTSVRTRRIEEQREGYSHFGSSLSVDPLSWWFSSWWVRARCVLPHPLDPGSLVAELLTNRHRWTSQKRASMFALSLGLHHARNCRFEQLRTLCRERHTLQTRSESLRSTLRLAATSCIQLHNTPFVRQEGLGSWIRGGFVVEVRRRGSLLRFVV